jgi:crotonobetainyl-CoA:carnitine CoA-transferase CaiB-like acyl-CoA transferase
VRLPPPRLGEHTRSVLMNDLGLDDESVRRLLSQGVVSA